MATPVPFKEQFFNRETVARLADRVVQVVPGFDREGFVSSVMAELPSLELKDRVRLIARALRARLEPEVPALFATLVAVTRPDPAAGLPPLEGFLVMPLCHVVEEHGLEHLEASLETLHELTKAFSAEFAIRPFLLHHPVATIEQLRAWAGDPDPRVRRLVSEGTRPRLPWGQRLPPFQRDPGPVLELLELLRADPDPVVRRSVANNLNDIAKDNPAIVIETVRRWAADDRPETRWLVRHACRTLVKQGHPEALEIQGFDAGARVAVEAFTVAPAEVRMGGGLELCVRVRSLEAEAHRLVIDYCVHHLKANGRHSPKVFKGTVRSLEAGQRVEIRLRHAIRPVSTRRYYPGRHRVELLINGQVAGEGEFQLVEGSPGGVNR